MNGNGENSQRNSSDMTKIYLKNLHVFNVSISCLQGTSRGCN